MQKSESIENLAAALSEFQGEVKNPPKTGLNPHFNSHYVTLDAMVDAAKPYLQKHGLSYIQSCGGNGELIEVTTMLMHKSGQWIESDPLVLKADKATAQGAGSAITYARRYALASMLGLASDEDDDGNGAEPKSRKSNQKGDKQINSEQASELMAALEAVGKDVELVYKTEKVTSLAALTYEQYKRWMDNCAKIKK